MKLFRKISKIFQYLPILWKDEEYDYWYILSLLKFKLSRTLKYFETSEITHTTFVIRDLKLAIKLIDIINNESECDSYVNISNIESYKPKHYLIELIQKNKENEILKSVNDNRIEIIIKDCVYIQKANYILWNLFRNRLETWWD
jgi:hypothetical protein